MIYLRLFKVHSIIVLTTGAMTDGRSPGIIHLVYIAV